MIFTRQQVRLLLPLGVGMALSLTGDLTMYTVLPNQTEIIGVGLATVGVLLGANRLIRIPGNLLAGALNDRLGRRRPLFLTGLCLGILSTLSYSFARSFWPLLAGRLLWGVAWSLINVGGYTMILDRSTPADRGRMTGFYQMAFMLGLTLSPILGGILTDVLGFRLAVRVCAAVSGVGLAVAFAALPETKSHIDEPRPKFEAARGRRQVAQLVDTWLQLDRRTLLASGLYLIAFFVNGGVMMSTISLHLRQQWGASVSLGGVAIGVSSLAGTLLAMRAALGALSGPLAGVLSDRVGDRWPVVRGAILLGTLGFTVLALVVRSWSVLVGVAMVALSAAALITALAALVGDMAAGSRQGIAMGRLATAGDIGSAIGPPLAYALAASLDLRWIYALCALALALGLLATLGQSTQVR